MKAIIVDDEYLARRVISHLLHKYFPKIELVGSYENVPTARQGVILHHPDILFLDIQMPGQTGFDLLDSLKHYHLSTKIVFTTSYDEYAIKAIKYSAFDYLLKPIDDQEFCDCLSRLDQHPFTHQQVENLQHNLSGKDSHQQITISHSKGLTFINVEDIIMLKSDNNYTEFFLKGRGSILSSKHLGFYEQLLEDHEHFLRCHKQYIINTTHALEYLAGDDNTVLLAGGYRAYVSRSQRKRFLARFKK